jgi:hypothetical protein
MAHGGYGVACLPEAQVRDDIRVGRLIPLMPEYEPKPSVLYAVYPSRRQLALRTRTVLEFLVQQDHSESAARLQVDAPDDQDMSPVALPTSGLHGNLVSPLPWHPATYDQLTEAQS